MDDKIKQNNSRKPAKIKGILGMLKPYYGILFVFVILVFIGACLSPNTFFTYSNFSNIFRQASIIGIIVIGQTFIIITGGIDLSVGSNMILCSVVSASILSKYGNVAAVVVALLVGLTFGLINGLLITKFKIQPFITTLGTMSIGMGLALIYSNAQVIIAYTDFFSWIGAGYLFNVIPIPVVIFIVVIVIGLLIEKDTIIGRYMYAIGGNEEAARLSAIKTDKIKVILYSFDGLLCGLAAIVLLGRMGSASSEIGKGSELIAIAAVVIGGTKMAGGEGSVGGSVIGILVLQIVNNLLNILNVPSYMQQAFQGLIIIVAIIIYQKQSEIKLRKFE